MFSVPRTSASRHSSLVQWIRRAYGIWPRKKNEFAFPLLPTIEKMAKVKAIPLIGSAWSYMPHIGRYRIDKQHLADIDKYKRYGPVVTETYGDATYVLVFTEEDLEAVVQNEGNYPHRTEFSSLLPYRLRRPQWYRSVGLSLLKGKEWYKLRQTSERCIKDPDVASSQEVAFSTIANEFVDRLKIIRKENKTIESFMQEISKWALECLTFVAFDKKFGCLHDVLEAADSLRLLRSLRVQLDCLSKMEVVRSNLQTWQLFPSDTWKNFCEASDVFSRIAFDHIDRALLQGSTQKKDTFLGKMIQDDKVNNATVLASDFLIEGVLTTASAFTFFLHALGRNPIRQQQLYEMIMDRETKKENHNTTSFDSIPFMKHCFLETTRLYPVFRGVCRSFEKPLELSGFYVPEHVTIRCVTQVMTRLEKYYENAEDFIPERWTLAQKKPANSCVPFGWGRRSCLGQPVAEQMMSLLLIEMLKQFKITSPSEMEIRTKIINLPAEPLAFRFDDRQT